MKKIVALLSATLLATGLTALTAAPAMAAPDPAYPLTVTATTDVPAGESIDVEQEVTVDIALTNPTEEDVELYLPADSETFLSASFNGTDNNTNVDMFVIASDTWGFDEVEDEGGNPVINWVADETPVLPAGATAYMNLTFFVAEVIDPELDANVLVDVCLNNATGNDCVPTITLAVNDTPVPPAPVCLAPVDVVSSEVTSNSAVIGWTAPANPDNNIEGYQLFDGETVIGDTELLSASLTDLSPLSDYTIDVVTLCSNDLRSSASSVTFTTAGLPANNPTITGPAEVSPEQLKEGFDITVSGFASNEDAVFVFSWLQNGEWKAFGTPDTVNVGPLGGGVINVSAQFEDGQAIGGTKFRITATGQTSAAVATYEFTTTGTAPVNPPTPTDNVKPAGTTPGAPATLASTGLEAGDTPLILLFGTLAMLLGGGAIAFARQKLV